MSEKHDAGHHAPVAYEKTDVAASSIAKAALIVAGVSTLTALALVGYIALLQGRSEGRDPQPRALTLEAGRQPPLPRLQEKPFEDIHALRAAEDAQLGGYGWVDRDAAVVHIPIEAAMRLFAERAAAGQLTVGPPPEPVASPTPPAAGGRR